MRSVRMIALSNLRKQSARSLLIGLTIAIAAFLATLSISLFASMSSPYGRMFEKSRGSHVSYFIDRGIYDAASLALWWRSRPGTVDCHEIPAAFLMEGFNLRSSSDGARKQIAIGLYLAEYDPEGQSDRLEIAQGDGKVAPGPGELWLPNTVARAQGIELGDTLEIPTDTGIEPFEVTAVVIDPTFSATASMSPARVWLGPGELAFHYAPESLHWEFLCARLSSPKLEREAIYSFNEYMGGAINGILYKYSDLLNYFSATFVIFAFALVALAALTLLIAAFSIYNAVSGSIAADYRWIGILKSLGFTPGDIIRVYATQFLLITAIAVPPTLVASFFASRYLCDRFLGSVGSDGGQSRFLPLALLCMAFFIAAIPAIAALVARRAGEIKAVDAIRLGESPGSSRAKSPLRLGSIRRMSLFMALTIKQLFAKKRRSLANGITAFLAAFVMVFGLDALVFFDTKARDMAFWGFDGGQVGVSRSGKRFGVERERLWTELGQDERALRVTPCSMWSVGVPSREGRPAEMLYGYIVDGDFDAAGFVTIAGRNPKNSGELALATNSLRDYRKRIGDDMELVIAGQRLRFEIVGAYQCISNLGQGFRLTKDGYARGDPSFKLDRASVILRDKGQAKAFVDSIEAKYGEAVDAYEGNDIMADAMRQVTGTVFAAILAFSIIILASSFAVIYNNTAMELDESRRVFGIYKTLGVTPGQIRMILCRKSAIVGAGSSLLGGLAVVILQGPFLRAMMSSFGFERIDLQVAPLGIVCATLGLGLFAALSAWIPSRAVKSLKVRELVVE